MSLFSSVTLDSMATSLRRYLPGGRLFQGFWTVGKNQYRYIQGLAPTLKTVHDFLNLYNQEIYPDTTVEFLEEWESALGIPDSCFKVDDDTSLADRQRSIDLKLAGLNVQTAQDFLDIALRYGVSATVVGGKDPSVFPVIIDDKEARFTIVIQFVSSSAFPYTFPFQFGNSETAVLTCLFEKIRPANCAVRFDPI